MNGAWLGANKIYFWIDPSMSLHLHPPVSPTQKCSLAARQKASLLCCAHEPFSGVDRMWISFSSTPEGISRWSQIGVPRREAGAAVNALRGWDSAAKPPADKPGAGEPLSAGEGRAPYFAFVFYLSFFYFLIFPKVNI